MTIVHITRAPLGLAGVGCPAQPRGRRVASGCGEKGVGARKDGPRAAVLGGLAAPSSGHTGTTLGETTSPRVAVRTRDLAGRCSSLSCHTAHQRLPRC